MFGYATPVNQMGLRIFQQDTCKIHSFNRHLSCIYCVHRGDKIKLSQQEMHTGDGCGPRAPAQLWDPAWGSQDAMRKPLEQRCLAIAKGVGSWIYFHFSFPQELAINICMEKKQNRGGIIHVEDRSYILYVKEINFQYDKIKQAKHKLPWTQVQSPALL